MLDVRAAATTTTAIRITDSELIREWSTTTPGLCVQLKRSNKAGVTFQRFFQFQTSQVSPMTPLVIENQQSQVIHHYHIQGHREIQCRNLQHCEVILFGGAHSSFTASDTTDLVIENCDNCQVFFGSYDTLLCSHPNNPIVTYTPMPLS